MTGLEKRDQRETINICNSANVASHDIVNQLLPYLFFYFISVVMVI